MANSIVFQSSAEQLKSAVFGYDGANYRALNVNDSGKLNVNVATINAIGTVNRVNTVGTINKLNVIGTVTKVNAIGTLNKLNVVGTITKVNTVGTLSKLNVVGTLNSIVGTVKVNLADRTFITATYTVRVSATSTTYTELLNISKYQDTSWYLRNTSHTANRRPVTVRLAVTPSTSKTNYPRVLISETATINNNPKVITNDYYMKYLQAQIANETNTSQTVVLVFNGRY